MADRNIKGITIEIGGDTKKLTDALSGVNRQSRAAQSELKEIERLIRFNPQSVELWEQRQSVLNEAISATSERLSILQAAEEQVRGQVERGEAGASAYRELQRQIVSCEQDLNRLSSAQDEEARAAQSAAEGIRQAFGAAETGTEANEDFAAAVERSRKELELEQAELNRNTAGLDDNGDRAEILQRTRDSLSRQLAINQQTIQSLSSQLEALTAAEGENADAVIDIKTALADAQAQQENFRVELANTETQLNSFTSASGKLGAVGDKMSSLGKSLLPLSAAITAGFAAVTEGTRELRTDMSRLEQNARETGQSFDFVSEKFKIFNAVTGETDSSVEAMSNLLQAGFKDRGLEQAVDGITGAFLRWPDTMKVEGLADSLQETIATGEATGQFAELIGRLGMNTESFAESMERCSTQTERQRLALNALVNNGLVDTTKEYIANNEALIESADAQFELQEAIAELGDVVDPIITELVEKITALVAGFNGMDESTKRLIITIAMLVAIVIPLISVIGSVFTAIGSISNAVSSASNMFSLFSQTGNAAFAGALKWVAIILAVVAAITALIIAINYLIGRGKEMNAALETVAGRGGGSGGPAPRYASGTSSHSGGFAIVGEEGPELLELPAGSKVRTASQTRTALNSRAGTGQGNTYINVSVDHIEDINDLLRIKKDARRIGRMGTVRG